MSLESNDGDVTYEIVFIADNPGKWVFHCHELHHAESEMIALMDYQEYEAVFLLKDKEVVNYTNFLNGFSICLLHHQK